MKFSASLFSKKEGFETYARTLQSLGMDYLHLDYLEGCTYPIELAELPEFKSALPADIHLIWSEITREAIEQANRSNAAFLCVQYETLRNKSSLHLLEGFNGRKGVAIVYETPLEDVLGIYPNLDFILIMCTVPGVSGATFDFRNIEKIELIREKYPQLNIHVDGGLDAQRIKQMQNLGVTLCICGSYFANADLDELLERICQLKYNDSHLTAENIMSLSKYITMTNATDDFWTMLENIERSTMDAAFVQDESGRFLGIVTGGDIRRALLKKRDNIFTMHANELCNTSAYVVAPHTRVKEILEARMMMQKVITTIPVIDKGKMVGVIDLNRAI